MSYTTQWNAHGIIWTFSGYTTFSEIESANASFYADPRSDVCRYQIFDGSLIQDLSIEPIETEITAAVDAAASQSIENMKVAIVSNGVPKLDAIYKNYIDSSRQMNSSWQFKLFLDLNSALIWVGEI